MSRYLGKLLIKGGIFEKVPSSRLFCEGRYIRSRDRFEFRSSYGKVKVDKFMCFKMANLNNNDHIFDKWSVGYSYPEKEENIKVVREKEINYLCGSRRDMFMNELVDSDSDFDLLCVIMSEFCISSSVLHRMGSRVWTKIKIRMEQKGRKLGSKSIKEEDPFQESDEEFKLRMEHNKPIFVEKGLLGFYLEACKEECKRYKVKYNKDAYTKEFLEKRKEIV